MLLVGYKPPTEEEAHVFLSRAIEAILAGAGQKRVMVDVATAYGETEAIVGRFIRSNPKLRESMVLSTKWVGDFARHHRLFVF